MRAQKVPAVAALLAVLAVLPCLAAANAGCIASHQHEGEDVMLEVLDRRTGQSLPEWVAESVLQSKSGGLSSDLTFETALRLAMAQSPGENTYHVDAFAEWSGMFVYPFVSLYHDSKDEARRIYAVGYEISDDKAVTGYQPPRKADGPAQPPLRISYRLSPWRNDRASPAVLEVMSMLEDKNNFRPYEALRGKPQGTGVPALYRYYIERFKAVVEADPDIRVKPSVNETVAWLEQAAAGTVAPSPWASPTTVRRVPACTAWERIFRVVAKDALTRKRLDSWVTEVDRVAAPALAPRSDGESVLVVDSRTAASPDTRVPPFINAERRQEGGARFVQGVTVYAFGYEPATVTPFLANDASVWPFDSPLCVPGGKVIECHLSKWNNNNARAFGKSLEDDERFAQYDRLRRQGSPGVLELYRYFLGRYDDLDAARQQELSEKARQRVIWIRQQVK